MYYLVLDTETTGLNPVNNQLVQLAGYVIDSEDGYRMIDSINTRIKLLPGAQVDKKALEVNKLTTEKINSFSEPNNLISDLDRLRSKYGKLLPVGWNISFDINMIKSILTKLGASYDDYFDYHSLDLCSVARYILSKKHPKPNRFKLATIADYLNIPINSELHEAREDARLTWQVLIKLQDYV